MNMQQGELIHLLKMSATKSLKRFKELYGKTLAEFSRNWFLNDWQCYVLCFEMSGRMRLDSVTPVPTNIL
jgi:hypothetical protein